ncbi:hypothetical protein ACFIOY_29720 [Bradyrhizobium sp. TZ2]
MTLVVRKLVALGALRSPRRGFVEIDRRRLDEVACECYKVMRCQYLQIFPVDTTKPRIRAAPAGTTPGDRDPFFWPNESIPRLPRDASHQSLLH